MTTRQMRWGYHRIAGYSIEIPDYGEVVVAPCKPHEVSVIVEILHFRKRFGSEVLMMYTPTMDEFSVSINDRVVGEKQELVYIKEALKLAKETKGLPEREKRSLDLLLMRMEEQ